MVKEPQFTRHDHEVWRLLYAGTARCRATQAHPLFCDGLARLGIGPDHIPDLSAVNERLAGHTGWQGVYVEGLEDAAGFFRMLANRQFPVGAFIRSADDLGYTPAPDVFHDLYGHLPFLADEAFAAFCRDFGESALRYVDQPHLLKAWETLFWFAVEFPLIQTTQGLRIFGGGIMSSNRESDYCLSGAPELRAFNAKNMAMTPYRIDQMQPILYVLSSEEQLYSCLSTANAFFEQEVASAH